MVFRRLAASLRRQDWVTVALELMVVVVGIFIGLQANAWNDARKDRVRELAHLEQVYQDLTYNAQRFTDAADVHAELASNLAFAIGVIKRGQIDPGEHERFKWAVLRMLQYPPPNITTAAFDTITASGDLSILRDQELKTRLVRLDSFIANLRWRVDALTGGPAREFPIEGATFATPHSSGKGIAWQVDFELLKNSSETLGLLANERRNHEIMHDVFAYGAQESENVRSHVGRLIGKQAEPKS